MANAAWTRSRRTSIIGSSFIPKSVAFSSTSNREKPTRGADVKFRDYAQQKLRDPLVITNPGVPCDEAFLARAVSNVTCVSENHEGFDQFD